MKAYAKNLPLAVALMAGILAFSYGASRALSGPVQQVARILERQPVQVVTVDQ